MTDRIRILHIVQNLNFGGMERIIAELTTRIDASRFETHVMAIQYLGHFSEGLDKYVTVHLAKPMSRWSMLYPRSLAQEIRAINPTIVHTHSGVWYKAGLAAKMAGVPLTLHTDHGRQNPDPWVYRQFDRLASYRTDIVVAVSEALSNAMAHIVVYPRRIRMIANGVDTERYTSRPKTDFLHRELGLAPDTPIWGSVGRLEPIKGYEVMIAAFARFMQLYQDAKRAQRVGTTPAPVLALIGDGSQKAALEQLSANSGVQEYIHFLGWRSDIEECLSTFSLFTMSSHSEGTSVSLLEAMSSGLCPVVTNVGGNAAVLGSPLRHRLVPAANPDALASAWLDTLIDPDRLASDAVRARERVLEDFGLAAMVRQYENLYEELAKRPQALRVS